MQKEQMLQLLNDGLKDIAENMEAIQKSFWRIAHTQYLDLLNDDDVQITICCEPIAMLPLSRRRQTDEMLCDRNCNSCPIINHPNNRLLTKILNELLNKFGDDVYAIVERYCPNITVCYDCRVDDFCHVNGCVLT